MSDEQEPEEKDYVVMLNGGCIAPDLKEFVSRCPEGRAFHNLTVSPMEIQLKGAEFIVRDVTFEEAYELGQLKCEQLNRELGNSLASEFEIERGCVVPVGEEN